MTRIRTLAAAGLLLPLSGVGLLVAATPAYAAGIVSPGNGVTFTSDQTIRIRADISTTTRTELRLKSPVASSAEQVVDSGAGTLTNNSATLDYDLQTDCMTYPSASCSGRAPAPNGTWTVRLSGGASGTSTFVLRIPPRTPASVTARADGYRAVVISWTKGDEPDLVGWTLYGDGGVLQDLVGLDSCSGSTCSTTMTYAADGTGAHTYALSARRSIEPGSSETVESARSADASATLDAPPPPSPEPASGGGSTDGGTTGGTTGGTSGGSTGGSTGGSAGGSTGGSSTPTGGSTGGATGTSAAGPSSGSGISTSSKPAAAIAQRRAFALTFKAFGPKLGIPKLPPLPATSKPAVAPLPDGTYEKTLGYKEVVKREKVSTPQAAATRVTGAVGSALDSDHFMRSLAGCLVLLLAAAHLRRWLGATHHEQ